MTDTNNTPPRSRLLDALEDRDREADDAQPADAGYTGEPCVNCGRIRVYLRRDGRLICEKCEWFQDQPASDTGRDAANGN